MDWVRKLIRYLRRRSSSNVDVYSDTSIRHGELQRYMAAMSTVPLRSGGGYDGCGSEDDLVRATRELLTQAATLPLSRRHELLAAAAALPEMAALFQTEAVSTPSAAATADATAPADGPRPAVPNRLDLPNMKRKLIELAEGVRASRPVPAPAAAALPAPSPPAAPKPEAEQQQQQQQQGGQEPMDVGEPAAEVAAAVAAAADALRVSVIPEYDQYGMAAGETVRAVVSIKAISEVPKRAQVALTCVLDRSGSMCGQPMELVQETVHFLIDQLTPDDYLGLVSYSGNVREDLPLLRMTTAGRAVAHRVVDALHASGSTALYDGLVAGVRQQMAAEVELRGSGGGAGDAQGEASSSSSSSRLVHSCFLFTDGQATDGPSLPSDIVSGLQKLQAPSGQHVTVHTFGFGSGHSVELLQAVAEAQSGVYYYISCTDDIASGFGDALGGLLAVVAKSVQVEVRPRPGVSLTAFRSGGRVIGAASTTTTTSLTSRGRAGSAAAAAAAVPTGATFNDMFAEETRECLLVLSIPPAPGSNADPSTAMELVVVDLSYTDVATGARVSRSAALHVRRAAAGRPAGQLPAELVFVTAARFETLDAIEAARHAAEEASDGEDVSGAHRLLDEQLGRLQSSPLQVPALTALAEQTRVAKISITPRAKRDQAGVAAVAGAVQALRHQRVATSAAASPSFHAQYDYKCKSKVRQTARAVVTSSRAAKLLYKVNED